MWGAWGSCATMHTHFTGRSKGLEKGWFTSKTVFFVYVNLRAMPGLSQASKGYARHVRVNNGKSLEQQFRSEDEALLMVSGQVPVT